MITVYIEDIDYRYILFPNYPTYTGQLRSLKYPVYIKQKDEDLSEYLKEMKRLGIEGVYHIDMPTVAEYCLDTPESVLGFMVSYLKFPDDEKITKRFKNLLEDEKKEFIKLSRAFGSWYLPAFQNTIRVYKLLEALALGKTEMLRVWYKLEAGYSVPRLWASFLTFCIKIYQYENIQESLPYWYKEALGKAYIQNIDFASGLKMLKNNKLPYSVLVPKILWLMRNKMPLDNDFDM